MRFIIALISLMGAVLPASAQTPEAELAPVVIALQELPRGFYLSEEAVLGTSPVVGLVFYPAEGLPVTAVQSLAEVVGTIARTDIPAEQPLVAHYLLPHPLDRPQTTSPYPISPDGYSVVQDIGLYREVRVEEVSQFTLPARLAAGDVVDLIGTTTVGNLLQDESWVILESVVIAQRTPTTLTFSVTPEQVPVIEAYVQAQTPITVVLRAETSQGTPFLIGEDTNRISWEQLTTRAENPLIIPDGANISDLERSE